MRSPESSAFQTTRWSMILSAADEASPQAQKALDQLCCLYWRPLFVYCCGLGHSKANAEDLTQGYFAQIMARGALRFADPERGKFRTFLLSSFKNYLTDVHRKGGAEKRGGGAVHVSFEMDVTDPSLLCVSAEAGPERAFDQQWAQDVVRRATEGLRREYADIGKGEWFELVAGDQAGPNYQALAERFGSTEDAIKSFALRVRKRFRALLEREIADTVSTPEEIPSEMAYLAELLRN